MRPDIGRPWNIPRCAVYCRCTEARSSILGSDGDTWSLLVIPGIKKVTNLEPVVQLVLATALSCADRFSRSTRSDFITLGSRAAGQHFHPGFARPVQFHVLTGSFPLLKLDLAAQLPIFTTSFQSVTRAQRTRVCSSVTQNNSSAAAFFRLQLSTLTLGVASVPDITLELASVKILTRSSR